MNHENGISVIPINIRTADGAERNLQFHYYVILYIIIVIHSPVSRAPVAAAHAR